jgi:hypothetical protein
MGISGFFYYLKNNRSKDSNSIKSTNNKKYEYLVLDVHSLFYNIKSLYEEINYLIRILFEGKNKYDKNIDYFFNEGRQNYLQIKYIFNNYKNLFPKFDTNNIKFLEKNIEDTKHKINLVLELFPISNENIKNAVKLDIVKHIEDLTKKYTKSKNNSDTLIYFDGIPSVAKIKEQLNRRIGMSISKMLHQDIVKSKLINSSESLIQKKLINNFPVISLDEPLINETREILIKKGFIVNNKLKYGEAEHQIMTDLRDEKFKNKNILLCSPDADLILLNMIIKVINNVNIDIYRETVISSSNFEFWDNIEKSEKQKKQPISFYSRDIKFILINNLYESFNLKENQEILDFAYLCLLLGDDFIPIISTLSINILPKLIETYKKLNKPIIESDYKSINYENLIEYIRELKNFENDVFIQKINKNNKKITNKLKESEQKYIEFLKFMKLTDNIIIKKIFYLDNGIIVKDDGSLKLLTKEFTKELVPLQEDQMKNYLQGYKFIFDLYIKGNITNYKWVYQYNVAPSLNQIYNYLKDKRDYELNILFNYSNNLESKNIKYFDLSTYKKYIEDNKNNILKNIIKKININVSDNIELTPEILAEYFTYQNIEIIYKCNNALYIQHCINNDVFMLDPSDYDTNINSELIGGGVSLTANRFYQKYLKYKNKYIILKKLTGLY